MPALLVVLSLLVGAGAGYTWPRALSDWQEQHAVYGEDIDHSMPWGISACHKISEAIGAAALMQEAGAKKSGVMRIATNRLQGEEYAGQILRELSDAWDTGNDAEAFYDRCAGEFMDHLERHLKDKDT